MRRVAIVGSRITRLLAAARALIEEKTGASWRRTAVLSKLGIARDLLLRRNR